MSQAEVEKIMGKPYRILEVDVPAASTRYEYKVPDGVDAYCEISFDSTMHVVDVFFGIVESDFVLE